MEANHLHSWKCEHNLNWPSAYLDFQPQIKNTVDPNAISEKRNEKNPNYYFNYNKRNKIPRNKLNKGCEAPYIENYKALLKETEKDTVK